MEECIRECRQLGPKDEELVDLYVTILNKGLDDIEHMYVGDTIAKARKRYTSEYILSNLGENGKERYMGHFTNDCLDGILIESPYDKEVPGLTKQRTDIEWVVAYKSGQKIGRRLIEDCIGRARHRGDDAVALVVSADNEKAVALYKKLEFIENMTIKEKNLKFMIYFMADWKRI